MSSPIACSCSLAITTTKTENVPFRFAGLSPLFADVFFFIFFFFVKSQRCALSKWQWTSSVTSVQSSQESLPESSSFRLFSQMYSSAPFDMRRFLSAWMSSAERSLRNSYTRGKMCSMAAWTSVTLGAANRNRTINMYPMSSIGFG